MHVVLKECEKEAVMLEKVIGIVTIIIIKTPFSHPVKVTKSNFIFEGQQNKLYLLVLSHIILLYCNICGCILGTKRAF